MRCSLLVAAVCLLLVVSAACAQSYVSVWEAGEATQTSTSSWFGNVGMIVTPTAAVPAPSAATAQWHRVDRDAGTVDVIGVNFGVTNWLEIGGARVDDEAAEDAEEIANVKVLLPVAKWFDEANWPTVAIGAVDVTNELNRSFYLVLSKDLSAGTPAQIARQLKVHLGVADSDSETGALDGVFGGIEFAAFRDGVVQAEYDGDAFNAALRYTPMGRISLDIGTLDSDFGFGLTYRSNF
ncbi:MAG: hypothetical protein ABFE08_12810 [Armatimonadia bacterium]